MDLYMLIAACGVYVLGFVVTSAVFKPEDRADYMLITSASLIWPVLFVFILPARLVYLFSKWINQTAWGKR